MHLSTVVFNAALYAGVLAHGGVRSLTVDGKTYWGWNAGQDSKYANQRIAFKGPKKFTVFDQTSKDMACNAAPAPPMITAPARAGSLVTFQWNPWYQSHLGPLISYLAPYGESLENVDVNKLNFFKISERGLLPDNKTWAVDEMMANGNISTTVIPHDIKPGNYVLRHELIALHYATEDSLYHMKADKALGPQHYIQCFNIKVEGSGTAQPKGVQFPGAYKPYRQEPGLYFDIWRHVSPYPIPGPELYVPQGSGPELPPLPATTQSPTGNSESDKQYLAAIKADAMRDSFTASVNSKNLGYGGNPDMDGPPPGSVPSGATVRGAKWKPTEKGLAGVEIPQ